MKKLTFKILLLLSVIFISCSEDEMIFDSETKTELIKKTTTLNSARARIDSPDWYNLMQIDFYYKWGIKITTMVENEQVIGVSSEALNRPDFTQDSYSWTKVYNSKLNEYRYRITLEYTIEIQDINWGGDRDGWWEAFEDGEEEDEDDIVIFEFNDQSNTSINASTTEITFWIKRSDSNSMEYVADCINGNCPE